MLNKEKRKLANNSRKPKLIYKCYDYIIEEIPLNYRATIKCARKPKDLFRKISRRNYFHPEHGLDHAKEETEKTIQEFFISGKRDTLGKGLKNWKDDLDDDV